MDKCVKNSSNESSQIELERRESQVEETPEQKASRSEDRTWIQSSSKADQHFSGNPEKEFQAQGERKKKRQDEQGLDHRDNADRLVQIGIASEFDFEQDGIYPKLPENMPDRQNIKDKEKQRNDKKQPKPQEKQDLDDNEAQMLNTQTPGLRKQAENDEDTKTPLNEERASKKNKNEPNLSESQQTSNPSENPNDENMRLISTSNERRENEMHEETKTTGFNPKFNSFSQLPLHPDRQYIFFAIQIPPEHQKSGITLRLIDKFTGSKRGEFLELDFETEIFSLIPDMKLYCTGIHGELTEFELDIEQKKKVFSNQSFREDRWKSRMMKNRKMQFEFNLNIRWHNKRYLDSNNLVELMHYALLVITRTNYIELLPLLIQDFLAHQDRNPRYNEAIIKFLRALEYIMQSHSKPIDPLLIKYILVLLGLLPFDIRIIENISDEFFNILDYSNFLNRTQEDNTHHLELSGLVKVLISAISRGNEIWHSFIQSCERIAVSLPLMLLGQMNELNLTLSDKDFNAIMDRINFKDKKSDSLLHEVIKDFKFDRLVKFIDNMQNRLTKDKIRTILNDSTVMKTTHTLEQISSILQPIQMASNRVKKIIYDSEIPQMIQENLNHFKGHVHSLDALSEIFVEYKDECILSKVRLKSLAETILTNSKFSLIDILEIIDLDEKDYLDLVGIWINRKFNLCRYRNEAIQELNIELSTLKYQEKSAKLFIEKLWILSQNRKFDIIDLLPIMDEANTAIKDELLKLIGKKIIPSSTEATKMKIVRLSEENPENEFIMAAFTLIVPPSTDLSIEKIQEELIRNPTRNQMWGTMLKNYVKNRNNQYTKLLVNLVCQLGQQILAKDIKISTLNRIKQLNPTEREDYIWYFEMSFRAMKIEKNFKDSLENCFAESEKHCHEIEVLREFLDQICREIQNSGQLFNMVEKHARKYESSSVCDIGLSPEIAPYVKCAIKVHTVLFSAVFKNVYIPEQNATLNTQNIIDVSTRALDCMDNELRSLMADLKSFPMQRFIQIFSAIQDANREVKIINNLIRPPNINDLQRCVEFYFNIDFYIESCNSVLSMTNLFGFSDSLMMTICTNFIQHCPTGISTLSVGRFYDICQTTKGRLIGDMSNDEYKIVMKMLTEIASCSDLIEFLYKLKEEELEHMKESVNDYEEELYVNTQIIFNLEHIYQFIKKIQIKNYSDFIRCFRHISQEEYHNLVGYLRSCIAQLSGIIDLHRELNCKEEAKKKQIQEIYQNSIYKFIREKKIFKVRLQYLNNQKFVFSLEDLLELKDRASLIMNASEEEEEVEIFRGFVDFVNTIQTIIKSLNELQLEGHPHLDLPETQFKCKYGDFGRTSELEANLTQSLTEWKNELREAYKQHSSLTYLFGRQFWTIENYLIKKQHRRKAENLMQFMGKQTKKLPRFKLKSDEINERLNYLGSYLDKLPNVYQNLFRLNKEPIITQENREILFVNSSDYLKAIVSLFLNSGLQFPKASQIFYCRPDVHTREIDAFLYRCFNNSEDLFVLVNSENLLVENQNYFRTLFHHLCFENQDFYQFKLALVTSDPSTPLIRYFKYHEDLKFTPLRDSKLLDDQDIAEIIQEIETGTLVVTSKTSGLGKTHWIHQQNAGRVVNFPISGNIDTRRIGKRLSSLVIPIGHALNLQIGDIDKPDVLNEILISLTLFRIFNYMKDIFVVPCTLKIYIEIANTFQEQLLGSIPYIRYLRHEHIDRFKLEELESNKNLQFVCNYLERFKTGEINRMEINEAKLKIYSTPQIQGLLQEYFLNQNEEPTYTQLSIFTKVLSYLLKNFRLCSFFSLDTISQYIVDYNFENLIQEFSNLRSVVIEGLVLTTKEFTTKSIKNTRNRQDEALGNPNVESLEANFSCNLTWESSNHFNLIILPDGSTMPIYRDQTQVSRNIKKLIYISEQSIRGYAPNPNAISSGNCQITEYSSLNHVQLLEKLKIYKGRDLPSLYYNSEYVITPDNFLKMNLIYLRVNSGVPVVIMGETGCGKTSLIRFLVECVIEQELRTVSIHAGIYTADIIEIVQQLKTTANELGRQNKQLWVFFDEFNTSESIATICEILCNRSVEGTPLPDNMFFVGACNPYRLIKRADHIESIGIKRAKEHISESQKLVHTVYPLPSSIIDYVWDFGALTENDMKKYVRSMLRELDPHILDMFVEMVCFSHAHFQRTEDKSSVSLRDVRRFLILYNWFKSSFVLKQQNRNSRYFQHLKKYKVAVYEYSEDLSLTAGIIALCHCYYLRLSSQRNRNTYLNSIQKVTKNYLDPRYILQVLENEQTDYLARMELPEGTAFNLALKENIFAMIPCIINKIPIFVCGKPGCSKSLSIQLIFSNLRGNKSMDDYFKTLPELIMVPFQGSDSCTSEGIIKVFERAKKYLETEQSDPSKRILPVVVFDEIGLAEMSKHNPLKVLHGLLELENRNVGFVGISNWRLDASKMNRALYLARFDPEKEDLKLTAMSIYSSYSKGGEEHKPIIESLALAYYQLKEHFKKTPFADFYGLRDFYHLIKQVSKKLINDNIVGKRDEAAVAKKAIQRNFGGTINGTEIIGSYFIQIYHLEGIYEWIPDAKVDRLILENLRDKDSRYLMLIGRGDVMTYLLNKCLRGAERRVFVGSNLENDTNQEEYGFRSISDIMLYIERGVSVILNDMDHIYSSLYDLFNQNFAVSGERRYCRIALGAHFNPRCFVHENFHAIVLQDEDEVSLLSADPPFLNRFEKHNLTLDYLLKDRHKEAVYRAEEWIYSLINNEMCMHITNVFPIFSTQTLALLALDSSEDGDILAYIKRQLLKIAPSDILILTENADIDHKEKEYIKCIWKELHRLNFNETLQNMLGGAFNKLIALTYDHEISGPIFSEDIKELIYHANISSFKSEQDLRKDILGFYRSSNKQVYLMEIDLSKEGKHLRLLEFMFNSLEDETRWKWNGNKVVCLVVHMMRNIKYEKSLVMMESWEMRMFDTLGHSSFELSDEFLMLSTRKLLLDDEFVPFHSVIRNLTEKCILNLKYEVKNIASFSKDHMYLIFENIEKDEELIDIIRAKVLNLTKHRNLEDWKMNVFYDTNAVLDSGNLFIAIRAVIEKELEKLYNPIVYVLEHYNAFTSYFTDASKSCSQILKRIWIHCFNRTSNEQNIRMLNTIQNAIVHINYPLYFPFFQLEYDIILNTYKEQSKENNEFFVNSFIAKYRENSKFSEFLLDIERNEKLKDLFLRDFIRIKLHENKTELSNEDFIIDTHKSMAREDMCIEEELLLIIENEKILLIICKIINVFNDIFQKNVTGKFKLNRNENLKKKFTIVLEQLILDVFPTKQNTWDGFAKYLGKIETILNLLFALKIYEIKPNNIRILEFWVSLILLLLKANCKEPHIYKIVKNTPNNFASRRKYKKYLLGQLSKLPDCSDSMIYEFKAFYYILILEHSCEWIIDIAQECEKTEMWKHFPRIADYLLINSGLTDKVSKLIDENELNDDGNFHLPKNDIMKHIETTLKKTGLTSRFAVLLSDAIFKSISKFNQDSRHQHDLSGLESQHFYYQFFLRHNSLKDNQYPLIKRLVCSTVLKKFLELYSYSLINERSLSRTQRYLIDEVSVSLENNKTFQLYCIKTIYKLMNYNDYELSDFMEKRKIEIQWLNTFDVFQPRNKLDLFPYIKDIKKEYEQSVILCNTISNQHAKPQEIEKLIRKIISSRQRLAFGLAFMNQIFTLFYIEGSMDRTVFYWFNANRELIEQQLGVEFSLLIHGFVNNFPQNTLLHLETSTTPEDFYKILIICQIFVIIISHNREMSPLTDVFFENGSIARNFANRFNSKYVFGVEADPLYECLVNVSKNFDSLLAQYQSANICGSNCDYIYFIENCGRAWVKSTCPICKREIGGVHHVLVERPGHRMIAHKKPHGNEPNAADGKNLLAQLIQKYERQVVKGRNLYGETCTDSQPRGLRHLSYKMLRLVLNSSLYMAMILGLIDQGTLQNMFKVEHNNYAQFFKENIKFDIRRLYELLATQEPHLWVFQALSQLPSVTTKFSTNASTAKARDQFEKLFEDSIMEFSKSPVIAVRNFKETLRDSFEKASSLIDDVQEMRKDEESYPLLEFFRMNEFPDLMKIENSFNIYDRKEEFLALEVYFKNQADINSLVSFYPIIHFTNALLDKFNHRISREEARETPMRRVLREHPELQVLFDQFLVSWNSLGMTSLQHNCAVLEKIDFSYDTELIYFLVDNQEKGGGLYMTAMLKELAKIQNKLHFEFFKAISTSRKITSHFIADDSSHTIQSIKEEHIILPVIDQALINLCSTNNPDYGKGNEIIYSFDSLEKKLTNSLMNKKQLDTEKVYLVQYQFELLSIEGEDSGLLSHIRHSITQKLFTDQTSRELTKFFKELKLKEKDNYTITLREIYGSLEYMLSLLKNIREEGQLSIIEFAHKIKSVRICALLRKKNAVSSIKLENIVALYENIEMEYFPYMENLIRMEFRQNDKKEEVKYLMKRFEAECAEHEELPSPEDLRTALMRLIIRCLVAGLNPELQMSLYIYKEDFWDPSLENKLDQLEERFPKEILLSHAYVAYKSLNKQKSGQNKRPDSLKHRPVERVSRMNLGEYSKNGIK